jgi:hypothetical protein
MFNLKENTNTNKLFIILQLNFILFINVIKFVSIISTKLFSLISHLQHLVILLLCFFTIRSLLHYTACSLITSTARSKWKSVQELLLTPVFPWSRWNLGVKSQRFPLGVVGSQRGHSNSCCICQCSLPLPADSVSEKDNT